MRVTQAEIYRRLLSDLGTLNRDLVKYGNRLATGRILDRLKDSPAGSAALVSLADQDAAIDQYLFNTNAGSLVLHVADSALSGVSNLVGTIFAKGTQAASGIPDPDARAALALEIRSLRDQIVSLANSEVRGRHIFAGSRTTAAPFLADGDSVSYRGDGTVNALQVDSGTEVRMNFSGEAVFGPLFAAIESLLAAIGEGDLAGMQAALNRFAPALTGLSAARAQVGSGLNLLESVQSRLRARETDIAGQRSLIQDADMVEAALRLGRTQTALDAATTAAGAEAAGPPPRSFESMPSATNSAPIRARRTQSRPSSRYSRVWPTSEMRKLVPRSSTRNASVSAPGAPSPTRGSPCGRRTASSCHTEPGVGHWLALPAAAGPAASLAGSSGLEPGAASANFARHAQANATTRKPCGRDMSEKGTYGGSR